jgi:DNA-binding NtrC family response regulator
MKKPKILLADNEAEFLKTRQKILESEGYEVITASSPEEVEQHLRKGVNLAIVDLRLIDDKDEADLSGLALIKKTAAGVPKILLTGYPTVEVTRRALRPNIEGIPAAVDVISKYDPVDSFLRAVEQAMEKYVRIKSKTRFLLKISLVVIGLVLAASIIFIFVLGKGIKEVFLAIVIGLILEVIAAIFVKTIIEK